MKLATYTRFSTCLQKETSLEDQQRIIHEWAARNGHEIVAQFSDAAETGATTATRDGLQKLLREVDSKYRRFEGVAVHQLSRLSRDMGDVWRIAFKRLKFYKVRLIAVADGIDTKDPNAKMQVALKSLQNEMFLDDQRVNVKRGMDSQFMRGFSTGSLPFGYTSRPVYKNGAENDPRAVLGYKIIPDHDQAEIVREIYRRYLAGEGYRKIARFINESKGLSLTITRIYGILHNPMYFGRMLFNKHEHAKHPETEKTTFLLRDKKEWLHRYDRSLAIIDKKTWKTVHKIMKAREGLFKDRAPAAHHLLTGLLFCESCGGHVAIVRHSYYGCSNANLKSKKCTNSFLIQRESLEQVVIASIANYLPSHLEMLVDSVRHRIESSTQDTRTIHKRIKSLDEEAEHILASIQQAKFTGRAKQKAEAQYQRLNDEIEQLERETNTAGSVPLVIQYDKEVLKAFIADLPQALACDRQAGAELLAHVIGNVRIRGCRARLRGCPLCETTIQKVGPPHAHLHDMEFSQFIRRFPWMGATHDLSLTIQLNAKGLLKKEKIVGIQIFGPQTFPSDDFPPFEVTVLQPTIAA